MPSIDPHDLISDTLYHELRCCLGSATLWEVWRAKSNSGYDVIDGRHLNEMVMDFALAIRSLWRQVESDIGNDDLRDLLVERRERAMADAANDAERHGAQPVFTVEERP